LTAADYLQRLELARSDQTRLQRMVDTHLPEIEEILEYFRDRKHDGGRHIWSLIEGDPDLVRCVFAYAYNATMIETTEESISCGEFDKMVEEGNESLEGLSDE
jgi:hypothetical protein